MKKPFVSVIMPSYNHENYIREAIDSVLNQTIDAIELIVIDDCSDDHSWEIIESYTDSRMIKKRHTSNIDAWATINEGIDMAHADTIAILNSDDIFNPARLEILLPLFDNNQILLVGSGIEFIDENGYLLTDNHLILDYYDRLQNDYLTSQNYFLSALKGNFFYSTSNFVFKKNLFLLIHGFKSFHCIHDYEFLINTLIKYKDAILIDWGSKLLKYRYHYKNTIINNQKKTYEELLHLLIGIIPEMKKDNNNDYFILSSRLMEITFVLKSLNDQELSIQGKQCLKLNDELSVLKEQYIAIRNNYNDLYGKYIQLSKTPKGIFLSGIIKAMKLIKKFFSKIEI